MPPALPGVGEVSLNLGSSTSSKIDHRKEREPLHRSIKRISSEKDGEKKTRSDRSCSMSPLPLTRRRRSSAEEKDRTPPTSYL
ncbi:hypothetical protein TNCT_36391 [Trichonephila clavata]|uniref:Uncharacterized protein n=1 Tax=Trichonephila clavata TaxID=2740835 RepID=A0A8X6FWD1_TRICU|nr:hypothetical protein TNCT_36391 [Trichonephila clavata]